MQYIKVLLLMTSIFSLHQNSAMLIGARTTARMLCSKANTQQARALSESCSSQLDSKWDEYDSQRERIKQLENAAEADNFGEIQGLRKKIYLQKCRALHKAKSIRVIDELLDAGLDINAATPTTPLHEVSNELIQHLLFKGADASVEDQVKPNLGRQTARMIGSCTNWPWNNENKVDWFNGSDIECEKLFPNEMNNYCYWNFSTDHGTTWTKVSLNTSAPAYAAQCANLERFEIFLKHVNTRVLLPQLPKIFFITRLMPLVRSDKAKAYQIIYDMLKDYEQGYLPRLQK